MFYFDNNASTPIDMRVIDAMLPALTKNFANPSSSHRFGMNAKDAVSNARAKVAGLLGAENNEILFTSGATESINIALKGVANNYSEKGKHIVTVTSEHNAVLESCRYLERRGFEVTYLPVNAQGLIDLYDFKNALRGDTILACVMFVNNETGLIQPIEEISILAHQRGAIFMTDATQAVGKIGINVEELGIDILCFSGHKMYAPKGIGGLYVKNGIRLSTFIHGGGQEQGLRSGTLNVPGIIALGKACEIAQQEMFANEKIVKILRDELEKSLLSIPGTFVNGSVQNRIYNTTNICFPGIDAAVLIGRMKNVAVSNGSACSSAVVEPSHVLVSMGLKPEEAFGSIRFSLGKFNSIEEVRAVTKIIGELIESRQVYA